MEQDKMNCENSGGTWTEVEDTWKCVHPESSESAPAEDNSSEEAE